MGILTVEATTLGDGWLATCATILADGAEACWGDLATRELASLTLEVARPSSDDATIAELGDPDWLAWMHRNFSSPDDVPELGGARSYAARLFDYAGTGRDQIAWVIDRLRADPTARDAAITTFEPLSDSTYIPCLTLLDFWRPEEDLELIVYAHSLDFGKKAYGNLVELSHLQERVGAAIGAPVGRLVIHVKTAHVYATELAPMSRLVLRHRSTATSPA